MVNNVKLVIFFSLFFLLNPFKTLAQCAMCRAQLESADDSTMAEGINNGIIVLMAAPYVLVGVLGVIIYRKFTKKKI
jgi:hypothetical protein